jgi:hypothetical protein
MIQLQRDQAENLDFPLNCPVYVCIDKSSKELLTESFHSSQHNKAAATATATTISYAGTVKGVFITTSPTTTLLYQIESCRIIENDREDYVPRERIRFQNGCPVFVNASCCRRRLRRPLAADDDDENPDKDNGLKVASTTSFSTKTNRNRHRNSGTREEFLKGIVLGFWDVPQAQGKQNGDDLVQNHETSVKEKDCTSFWYSIFLCCEEDVAWVGTSILHQVNPQHVSYRREHSVETKEEEQLDAMAGETNNVEVSCTVIAKEINVKKEEKRCLLNACVVDLCSLDGNGTIDDIRVDNNHGDEDNGNSDGNNVKEENCLMNIQALDQETQRPKHVVCIKQQSPNNNFDHDSNTRQEQIADQKVIQSTTDTNNTPMEMEATGVKEMENRIDKSCSKKRQYIETLDNGMLETNSCWWEDSDDASSSSSSIVEVPEMEPPKSVQGMVGEEQQRQVNNDNVISDGHDHHDKQTEKVDGEGGTHSPKPAKKQRMDDVAKEQVTIKQHNTACTNESIMETDPVSTDDSGDGSDCVNVSNNDHGSSLAVYDLLDQFNKEDHHNDNENKNGNVSPCLDASNIMDTSDTISACHKKDDTATTNKSSTLDLDTFMIGRRSRSFEDTTSLLSNIKLSWRNARPGPSDERMKDFDGRTYYWCKKCRGQKGMWALHHVDDHVVDDGDYFVPHWKVVPPDDDEPSSKEVKGTWYSWCEECRDGKGQWSVHAKGSHWRCIEPMANEPLKTVKDNCVYYWCNLCRNGKGMWARHRESGHQNVNDTKESDTSVNGIVRNPHYLRDSFSKFLHCDRNLFRLAMTDSENVPNSSQDPSVKTCICYHVKGYCKSTCKRAVDHQKLTHDKSKELYQWCKRVTSQQQPPLLPAAKLCSETITLTLPYEQIRSKCNHVMNVIK